MKHSNGENSKLGATATPGDSAEEITTIRSIEVEPVEKCWVAVECANWFFDLVRRYSKLGVLPFSPCPFAVFLLYAHFMCPAVTSDLQLLRQLRFLSATFLLVIGSLKLDARFGSRLGTLSLLAFLVLLATHVLTAGVLFVSCFAAPFSAGGNSSKPVFLLTFACSFLVNEVALCSVTFVIILIGCVAEFAVRLLTVNLCMPITTVPAPDVTEVVVRMRLQRAEEDTKSPARWCLMCMREFESGEMLARPRCQHVFHRECLVRNSGEGIGCPICDCAGGCI